MRGNLTSLTLPDGSAYTNVYDAAHRLTGTSDLLNDSASMTLDAAGDPTQMAIKDGSGNTRLGHSGVFDALGRAIQSVGGSGKTLSYAYDLNGNLTSITDGLNRATHQAFDALNRLVTVTDAAKGVTAISYDSSSRPVSVTDPAGGVTQYTYDGFGDLIQELSPTSGATVYRFDGGGNLIQKTDARGAIANYTYDALNRRISETYPGNAAENVTLTYDQNPLGIGRLSSVTDAAGTLARTYDERGNVLSETREPGRGDARDIV